LRLGVAGAAGNYATRDELRDPPGIDRRLTMLSFEGEYAFRYTKLSGELTRESFDAGVARDTAATWFVQGTQILSPRWFVAARQEGTSAPPFGGALSRGPRMIYKTVETAVGFRLSPEVTVRGSFFASKFYTRSDYDHQAGVSFVWSRRWW